MSYSDPNSTVQESCPYKWGQDVSCRYLIRRWQLVLELLFHYSPMVVLLHLCFPFGRSRRLPLVACRFLIPWSRFTENRIVLSNVYWQFGPSSFVLGHFFLFDVSLGLNMKWAGVTRFFGPTAIVFSIFNKNKLYPNGLAKIYKNFSLWLHWVSLNMTSTF